MGKYKADENVVFPSTCMYRHVIKAQNDLKAIFHFNP